MSFLETKIKKPLLELLKQGMTPQKLALCLAIGATISLSPLLFGITTVLCIAVAAVMGLNQVAIQVANYTAYPLQLILIIPFMKGGEQIFSSTQTELSLDIMKNYIQNDPPTFFKTFGWLFLYGTGLWLLIAPFLIFTLYMILLPIMKRLSIKSAT